MLDALCADMKHYEDADGWYRSPGFWVTTTYRFGSWSHRIRSAPVRLACLDLYKAAAVILRSVSPGAIVSAPPVRTIPREMLDLMRRTRASEA